MFVLLLACPKDCIMRHGHAPMLTWTGNGQSTYSRNCLHIWMNSRVSIFRTGFSFFPSSRDRGVGCLIRRGRALFPRESCPMYRSTSSWRATLLLDRTTQTIQQALNNMLNKPFPVHLLEWKKEKKFGAESFFPYLKSQ